MSDSFADLWSSAAPIKPAQPQKKLGDLNINNSQQVQQRRPQQDAFSLLATPNSNTATRSSSPSGFNPQKNGAKPQPPSNGDAFSNLLSGSFTSTTNGATLTMAERAAKAEREKSAMLLKQQQAVKAQAAAWSGLDSLGGGGSRPPPVKSTPSSSSTNDVDWIFDNPAPAKQAAKSAPPIVQQDDDDWGLSDFVSAPAPAKPQPAPKSQSLWDDEAPPHRPSRANSPGDFDFGDREDRLLDDDSNDEDDVLGVLAKPADKIPRRPSANANVTSPPRSGQNSRAVSPPPHIIGQIVEMGFSPQQARAALAATDTGLNVQSALEMLLGDAPTPSQPAPASAPQRRPQQQRRSEPDDSDNRSAPRRRPTDSGPSREQDQVDGPSDVQKNIQEQADKLLAQASEIGFSMFKSANAFWSQGKEKVQKAYEERVAATGSNTSPVQNGRPKWMQSTSEERVDDGWGDSAGFKDDDDDEESHPPPKARPPPVERKRSQPQQPQPKVTNLFEDESPTVYKSPFRRGTSRQQQQQVDRGSPSTSTKPTPQRVPSPIPVTRRNAVSATSSAIATCMKHKAVGTEMFKLGRFGEADTAYSSAIAALPDSHLLLVQLLNNRALARLKTGDHSGTVEDTSAVITLVGPSYHPAREAKVSREEEGSAVDLADGIIKAYRRRAEAYEGKEKWELAKKDWEIVAGTEWASGKMRSEAVAGVGRCRKMSSADAGAGAVPKSAPPPRSAPRRAPRPPVRRGPTPPSEALNKLRAATNAADAEDQEKHELKDTVDTKIAAWKTGKEANIRALIASLENVLWPTLGWQKVGMHELVTPGQVKVRYTKAIAKLHPDKLNANNTTLEQRMIANAVFGSLNDAWNAFKP